jgi:hypothetical protein
MTETKFHARTEQQARFAGDNYRVMLILIILAEGQMTQTQK